jgi:hypothetical protein
MHIQCVPNQVERHAHQNGREETIPKDFFPYPLAASMVVGGIILDALPAII